MPIYDIFETKESEEDPPVDLSSTPCSRKDRLFSILTVRVLFFLLLIADVCWALYSLTLFTLFLTVNLVSFFKFRRGCQQLRKQWIAIKRSAVCGVALAVSLFSPALGIMIACSYFLMYDKTGIQEVVPTSLQHQFEEFLK